MSEAAPPREFVEALAEDNAALGETPDGYRPLPEWEARVDWAVVRRLPLTFLCHMAAAQTRARAACREMNEPIFAAYRAHRARVDAAR